MLEVLQLGVVGTLVVFWSLAMGAVVVEGIQHLQRK